MIRLLLLIAAFLFAAAPALAEAPGDRTLDALKVFPFLDKFYAVPAEQRTLIALRYTLTHDGKPATDIKLTLMVDGRRIPLPIAPNGRVERLPSPAEIAAHAQLLVEAAPGIKFHNRLALDTAIRPAQEIVAADCGLAIKQANDAIGRAAGVMAMLAPKVRATTFEGSGSGVAVLADGRTTPLPLIDGQPAYDPSKIKDAKAIRLAKAPTLVSLE
jgi:hypothetical protein